MKFHSLLSLLLTLLILNCSESTKKNKNFAHEVPQSDSIKRKPPSSYSDTITINSPAAVFYNPDSLQLEKIKHLFTNMEFKSTVHECFYLMRNAKASLKQYWPQIRIVDVSKARFLLFIKSDQSKYYIDLNTKNDICGLFLFNQVKNPKLADMNNIGTELDFYFLK